MTTNIQPEKRKAYATDVTLRLGPIQTRGVIYSTEKSGKSAPRPKTQMLSPQGNPVEQVYRDTEGNIFYKNQLKVGLENEDQETTVLSQEVVKKAQESNLTPNVLELTAHPREIIDNYVYPASSQAYVFKPIYKNGKKYVNDPTNIGWYNFINNIIRDGTYALVGTMNLVGNEGFFRLGLHNGWVSFRKQLYPSNVHHFDDYEFKTPRRERRKMVSVVEKKFETEYSSDLYKTMIPERLKQLQGVKPEELFDSPLEVEEETEFDFNQALKELELI